MIMHKYFVWNFLVIFLFEMCAQTWVWQSSFVDWLIAGKGNHNHGEPTNSDRAAGQRRRRRRHCSGTVRSSWESKPAGAATLGSIAGFTFASSGSRGCCAGHQPSGRRGAVDEAVVAAVSAEAEDKGRSHGFAVRRRPAGDAFLALGRWLKTLTTY